MGCTYLVPERMERLTMQVEKVLPCVCVDHEPDAGDSVFYGMPELKIAGYKGNPLYTPYCPKCGRGGVFQYKSAYLALKAWNELIKQLRQTEED